MARKTTKLRVRRVIKGLTIRALASKIGYNEHTVSVTKTRYQNASQKLQEAFTAFFSCQCEDLFDEWGRALEYTATA